VLNRDSMKALWEMGVHFRADTDGDVVISAFRPFYTRILYSYYETEWDPQPVRMRWWTEKCLPS